MKNHKIGFRSRNGSGTVRFKWKSVQTAQNDAAHLFWKNRVREKKSKTMVFHGHIEKHRGCMIFQMSILRLFFLRFWCFFPKSCQECISKFILHEKMCPSWLPQMVWARNPIFALFLRSDFSMFFQIFLLIQLFFNSHRRLDRCWGKLGPIWS